MKIQGLFLGITLVLPCFVHTQTPDFFDCSLIGISQIDCFKAHLQISFKCFEKHPIPFEAVFNPTQFCLSPLVDANSWQCLPPTKINETSMYICERPYLNIGAIGTLKCVSEGIGKDIKTFYRAEDLAKIKDVCGRPNDNDLKNEQISILSAAGVISKRHIEFTNEQMNQRKTIDRIHKVFRTLDLVLTSIAFIILLVLIPWKNERVMLHRNLILTFVFNDIVSLTLLFRYSASIHANFLLSNNNKETQDENQDCSMIYVVHLYFFLAQVCWMFNELFYQFRQIYNVFITKKYIWLYIAFGWGLPFFVVFGIYLPILLHEPLTFNYRLCWAWYGLYKYIFIVTGPALVLLGVNVIIMTYLMKIIWSKLRIHKTEQNRNAKKSARSFFVILVLLGGGYIFTLYGPKNCVEFEYFIVLVLPIQGCLVAIFHVFLSREVIHAVRKKFKLWSSEAEMRGSEISTSTRRISTIFARSSRNTSVISISSGPPSRKTSRKESTGSFPSIAEPEEYSTQIVDPVSEAEEGKDLNNVSQNGHLPSAPPPILGPMSNIHDRQLDGVGDSTEQADVHIPGYTPNYIDFTRVGDNHEDPIDSAYTNPGYTTEGE